MCLFRAQFLLLCKSQGVVEMKIPMEWIALTPLKSLFEQQQFS